MTRNAVTALFPYGRDEYYGEVDRLLGLHPDLGVIEDGAEWDAEFEARMTAVEVRDGVVVLVGHMPPLPVNTERALRLNPPSELFQEWLREVAEVE